jgi:hypothetical protein
MPGRAVISDLWAVISRLRCRWIGQILLDVARAPFLKGVGEFWRVLIAQKRLFLLCGEPDVGGKEDIILNAALRRREAF